MEMFTIEEVLHRLWVLACKFDCVPTDSKFVCFSKGNKAAKLYNELMLKVAGD